MAPIRDWTGAITISPLPYCEIAAGWRWGICCGKGATALTFKDKNDCPLCGVKSYPFLNERAVELEHFFSIYLENNLRFITFVDEKRMYDGTLTFKYSQTARC